MNYPYSVIKLYQDCEILENENLIVDDIQDYLSGLTTLSFEHAQVIRNGLNIKLKLKLNAFLNVTMFVDDQGFGFNHNYCSIQSVGIKVVDEVQEVVTSSPVYYFVRNIIEVAPSTIELDLHCDVINTFKAGTHFILSDRTIVKREHKDRYQVFNFGQNEHIIPKVDFYSEGIVPKLFTTGIRTIIKDSFMKEQSDNDIQWYLIYKNSLVDSADANNVVNCFLAINKRYIVKHNNVGLYFVPSDFEEGKYYYFFSDSSHYSAIDIDGNTITQAGLGNDLLTRVERAGNYLLLTQYSYYGALIVPPYDNTQPSATQRYVVTSITLQQGDFLYKSNNSYDTPNNAYENSIVYAASSTDYSYTNSKSYEDVDTTDSRIIKIIKIPYAPTGGFVYVPASGLTPAYITFDNTKWDFDVHSRLFKLIDLHTKLNNGTLEDVKGYNTPISSLDLKALILKKTDLKGAHNLVDPKIYHSDYYQIKYIYDSFSHIFKIEDVKMDTFTTCELTLVGNTDIRFTMTRTINSRFLFKFLDYQFDRYDEDYYEYLIVQRNNEEVIYNSPYLNYLRMGYNYDVKAKNRQEAFSWFTTGAGLIAGGLSVAFGSKTLGVGLIASSVVSIAGAINTTITAEQNLDQKVNQLKWQANSVYGADDVDLMTEYSGNKLFRITYKTSERMTTLLNDIFFYTGYISNEMKVPDVNTRLWFNFLSCDMQFSNIYNIPNDCLEELKSKYLGGVFFLHKVDYSSVPDVHQYMWDFSRSHENYETWLFN